MAGKQVAGDGVPASLAGMSKNQLYDIMSQMKALIEQNHQQARQILVQNPGLTRALFQAQIMLGMVQPPQAVPTISPSASQNSQQSPMLNQQSNIQATSSFPGQIGQNQMRKQQPNQTTSSKLQSQSLPQPQPQPQPQSQPQPQPIPSPNPQPIPSPNPQPQSMPSQPLRSIQQPKVHVAPKSTPLSMPLSSQVPNMTPMLQHTAALPPSLHQPPMPMPSLSTQPQQPLQNTAGQYLPLQPPLQPPLPPQPRPQMPAFPHQVHAQMGPNLGFQHPSGQQLHHSQPTFHSAAIPPAGLGPSFLPGQPSLPNQSLPPSVYQAGGPHLGMEYNQVGNSNQTDRGSNWMPGMPDTKGTHLSGPPLFVNQMGPSNQPPRPPPLSPEMEKALLQQVMSLTPEQISTLPTEQRNQILQLQQMLRQ